MALVFSGAILVAPLLVLSGQGHAVASGNQAGSPAREAVLARGVQQMAVPGSAAADVGADQELVRFNNQLPVVTTTTAPPATTTTTTVPATTTTTAPPPTTTVPPPPPTTTTVAPQAVATSSATGIATWYTETPAGGCASPTLPRGTEVTVVNDATGATTHCVVDDREADNPGRVLDMSYTGFSSIADPSQGVVTVTITW
ncbi:MAG TPA: septal ring lytic transglycosylase RlpA family protein [Acidimicrobiales bacterium]|nr:septal ring lytic transglycosylase RlpA family protein [Acidimicrobiales bacterium]